MKYNTPHTRFEKLFYISWNYAQNSGNISGTLMLLDVILMPVNYTAFLLNDWTRRIL